MLTSKRLGKGAKALNVSSHRRDAGGAEVAPLAPLFKRVGNTLAGFGLGVASAGTLILVAAAVGALSRLV